jgi:hypothetical protein
MSDDSSWTPFAGRAPRASSPARELWTMTRGVELCRAELREREGDAAELQFWAASDVFMNGRHYPHRALAIADADAARDALEGSGWTCARCRGERWTCERHRDEPTAHDARCSGADAPCRDCNTSDPPRPPRGFVSDVSR